MVYKRYIKRGGRTFGPYYYESYRDSSGNIKSKYLKDYKPRKNNLFLVIFLCSVIILFGMFSYFFILEGDSFSENSNSFSRNFVNVINPVIEKVSFFGTGFSVDNSSPNNFDEEVLILEGEEESEKGIEEDFELEEDFDVERKEENTENYSVNGSKEIEENLSEEEILIENESLDSLNESSENSSYEEINFSEGLEGFENDSNSSFILEDEGEFILELEKEVFLINEENFSKNLPEEDFELISSRVILGETVKWIKKVNSSKINSSSLRVEIPKNAENIQIKKGKEISKAEEKIRENNHSKILENKTKVDSFKGISSNVVAVSSGKNFLQNLDNFFKRFSLMTGLTSQEDFLVLEDEYSKEVVLNNPEEEIAIEYETPAAYSIEEELPLGKRVKIIGPEGIHYENVLAFTNLSEDLGIKEIFRLKIYWVEEDEFLEVEGIYDLNENGVYDYLEWNVPHLSNQTFEIIIEITHAEHLDSNRNFISDIYEEVKKQDDIWSDEISDGEYVRVKFEENLTKDKDITIYPRVISGNPRVEVYEIDSEVKIAEFSSINSYEYNKIYLDGLENEQDSFDLRVVEGVIQFDHIIDPINFLVLNSSFGFNTTIENLTVWIDSTDSTTDIIDWRLNGTSLAVLNMPFDTNYTSTTPNGLKDYSMHENNGTLGGGTSSYVPAWNSNCVVGGCYEFDGSNDYINLSSITETDSFTLSLWVYFNSLKSGGEWIINQRGPVSTNNDWQLFRYPSTSNKLRFSLKNSADTTHTVNLTDDNPPTETWIHLAVVYDNDNDKLQAYTNGSLFSEIDFSGVPSTRASQIMIGKAGWTDLYYPNGLIDELMIFNRSLSVEQIAQLYEDNLAGKSLTTLVSQETSVGDNYSVMVTPNDGIQDGTSVETNWLEISDTSSFLNILYPLESNPLKVVPGQNFSVNFDYFSNGSEVTSGLKIEEVLIGNISAYPSISWGDTSQESSTTNVASWLRCMGGNFTEKNKVLSGVYISSAGSGNARLAIYQGGTLSDPNGANLVWDAGEITAGSGFVGTITSGIALNENEATWICVKGNDNTFTTHYRGSHDSTSDFQSERGRWQASGMNVDETVAYPSTISGAGTSFSSAWYSWYLVYEDRSTSYISGTGWQTNVTAPSGLEDLEDLFINVSYNGESLSGLEENALDYRLGFEITSAILNSSLGTNTTSENLTVYISSENTSSEIIDWRVNGTSIAVINIPSDTNTSGAVKDYSTYENDGSLVNSPVWISEGLIGGAYEFTGVDDGYMVPFGNGLNTSNVNLTYSFWVKNYGTGDTSPILFTQGTSSGSNRCYVGITGGKWAFGIQGSSYSSSDTSISVENNEWYHIVLRMNSGNASLFVNGDYAGSKDYTSFTFNRNLLVGYYTSSGYNFNGIIDEVLVFNKSLSNEQIAQLYEDNLAGKSLTTLVSQETSVGDNYSVMVTPNDGIQDGTSVETNWLEISDTSSFLNILYPLESNPLKVVPGQNFSVNFDYFSNGSEVTSGLKIEEVLIGNISAYPSISWGDDSQDSLSTTVNNWVRCMGGNFTENNKVLTGAYVSSAGSGNARLAIYQGGTLSDPNGANLVWDAGEITAGSGYVGTITEGISLNPDEATWICMKGNDGTFGTHYRNSYDSTSDFQSERGRWVASGMNVDETVAYPSTISGAGTSFSSAWYSWYLVYEDRSTSYISGTGWQTNVTAPSGLEDLEDLFINVSYNGESLSGLEENALDYRLGFEITSAILNSSLGTNTTSENLTVYISSENTSSEIIDWRVNGTSLAVLNMPFDTNITSVSVGGIRDYSTYGNNATLGFENESRAPLWRENCQIGGCYEFDGLDKVIHSKDIELRENVVVSAWVKINTLSGTSAIYSNYDNANRWGYKIGITSSGIIELGVGCYHGYTGACTNDESFYRTLSSTSSIDDTKWYHIVGSYDREEMRIYIDGELDASVSETRNMGSTSSFNSCIGIDGPYCDDSSVGWNNYFNGSIDDLLIFNKSFSPQQIEAIYQAGLEGQSITTLVSQETSVGDNYSVLVVPTNGSLEGYSRESNWLEVSEDIFPEINSVILNSSLGTNTTDENLTVWIDSTGSTTDITDWRLSGTSLAVLNLPFDTNDSSIAKDYSTNENNGTISGATWTSSGKVGGAYEFDGINDMINLSYGSGINPSSIPLTITFWAKPKNTNNMMYITTDASTNDRFYLGHINGYWDMGIQANSWNSGGAGTSVTTNWTHVALVMNGTSANLYINGTYDFSKSYTSYTFYDDFILGKAYSGSYPVNGSIDELIIFNRSLSAEQIAQLYEEGLAGKSITTLVSQETSVGDNYTVIVTPNDGIQDGTSVETNWLEIIEFPKLNLERIYPLGNLNVAQNEFFNITLNVSCLNADCGDINVSFDPETVVNTTLVADGSTYNNIWYSNVYFGWNDLNYPGWSFELNNEIPEGAIITHAYFRTRAETSSYSSDYNSSLHIENVDPATNTNYGSGHKINTIDSIRNYTGIKQTKYLVDDWYFGENDEDTLNIKEAIQDLVDEYGSLSEGDIINIWLTTSGYSQSSDSTFYKSSGELVIKYIPGKYGLIPFGSGDPFYTNETNPRTINLNEGESVLVNAWINATGEINSSHEFFEFANLTSDMSISNFTEKYNVTIIEDIEEIKFRTVWNTSATSTGSSNTTQITLPLVSSGEYDFKVDWGDGSSSIVTSWDSVNKTHNYASAGVYQINITGTITGWQFNNGGDKLKLSEISEWGPLNLGNAGSYFYGAENLEITAADVLNTTGMTSFYNMFRSCSSLTTIPNIGNWDTSKVTTMGYMFQNAKNANPDTSNWDTSKVISMSFMFSGAENANPNTSNWDTSNVTTMSFMFQNAKNANPDTSNWNTSKVTNFGYMFSGAENANPNTSNWDTSKVSSMGLMFNRAYSFDQDLGSWNISSLSDATNMFLDVTLSTINYDSLLIGWADQSPDIVSSVSFSGGNSKYSLGALSARNDILISDHDWSIVDGGLDSDFAFNSTWNTTKSGVSGSAQIALPLQSGGNYDFWVFGNTLNNSPVHITSYTNNVLNFSNSGVHNISIYGTIEGWQFNNGGDRLKLIEISSWGPLNLGNSWGDIFMVPKT